MYLKLHIQFIFFFWDKMNEERYLEGTVDDEIIVDGCWRMVTRVPARLHRTLTNLISCFQFFKG